jgi:dTDP-4-amino-4,6-dideoxygalactose transaminase
MAGKRIALFTPSYRIEETLAAVRECLEVGWTGLGFKTDAFEAAWREYTELPYAHFVNSATAALHMAVEGLKMAGDWKEGDEIITTPLTFVSTNHAILYAGMKPVFADVDETLNITVASIEAVLSERTRAVMFVGMGGNPAHLREVSSFCRERGLRLILDAAHMAGTRVQGRHVGHEADATCFSFQAVKNLPTADSGMVCFADAALDTWARKWSWLGINKNTFQRTGQQGSYRWDYDVEHVGHKYNGNSIMAAIGLVSLKYLDHDNAYRRQLAEWYDDLLPWRALLPDGTRAVEAVPHSVGSSRHLYQIVAHDRDALMVFMNANDIYPGVHYKDNRAYAMYAPGEAERCPVAWEKSRGAVSLPMSLAVTRADVVRVMGAVGEFYARAV